MEKATPELATRSAGKPEGHFRNTSHGYQRVTDKCYAKLACKYAMQDKGLCLPDWFGKENVRGYAAAQSRGAAEMVRYGLVPGHCRVARGLLLSELLLNE